MKLRRLRRREVFLLVLLAVAAVGLLRGWADPAKTPVTLTRSRPAAALPPVPRIGLDRLDDRPAAADAGRRDLFAFGAAAALEGDDEDDDDLDPLPTPEPRPVGVPTIVDPSTSATARLPPLNLKFIGAVGNSRGVKVAVLLTDRNEVLTGQQGDVVANRYRIEHIGLESVDLADVGTGQSRRIPLKGD